MRLSNGCLTGAIVAIGAGLIAFGGSTANGQERLSRDQIQFFESRIRPPLVEHCYECHSAASDEAGGKLLLDTRDGLLRGGESGPAVVPGRPTSSLLLVAIQQTDSKLVMPPTDHGEKLSPAVIADFERWIRSGAPDPRSGGSAKKSYGSEESRDWWAWQPIAKVSVPAPEDPERWIRSDIDRFILDKLQQAGLKPSEDADRLTLIRRVAFDLTGLPPTMEVMQRFALASEPGKFEDLVDQYLDSPQYGERMARRWLDVARYAESSGKDVNVAYPFAWRYRDYVIDAFQNDKPYNRFVAEQIAGDLLHSTSQRQTAEQRIATGFLALGTKGLGEQNPRQFAVDQADEQIDTVSQAFLGVTIACARCHDHKFDPISQRDYTAMAGIFLSTQTHFGTTGGVGGRNRSDLLQLPDELQDAEANPPPSPQELARMKDRLADLEEQRREFVSERLQQRRDGKEGAPPPNFAVVQQQLVGLQTRLDALDADGSTKALTMGVSDKPVPTGARRFQQRFSRAGQQGRPQLPTELMSIFDSPQLIRGELDKPGDVVPRGLPEFLAGGFKHEIDRDESGRAQLAAWITSTRNPLTPRVMVNRIWHWLYGQGLVTSVDNFGTTGDRPSHPELLDFLATQFMAENWSVKKLVRKIVLSHAYSQSTAMREDAFLVDPENRLLWRAHRRTLDAECLRDGLLATSGSLDLKRPHGSAVSQAGDGPIAGRRDIGLTEDEITQAGGPFRSLYLPVPRNILPDPLELFDFADNSVVTGARSTTIVPAQSLYWMNNKSVEVECRKIADRILKGSTDLNPTRCNQLFSELTLEILGRQPLTDELNAATAYALARQNEGVRPQTIWMSIARSLLASADYRLLK